MKEVGTYRAYGPRKNLQKSTLDLIAAANRILDEYEGAGHTMTLRQLYYQMVARGLTDGENSDRMYERIGNALNTGRMQGLVSWTAMEDRGRGLRGLNTYRNISQVLKAAKSDYRRDLWVDQQWRPEVWIEKEALVGVIGSICNKLRVDFFACKGYNSQSEQWRAGKRFQSYISKGQRPIVFHLGDHDPSGIDMTRDNQERLSTFTGVPVIVQRLALNMPQVEEFNPPPNPTKMSDSRKDTYIAQFGYECWELDALEPTYIEKLIEDAVLKVREPNAWNAALRQELEDKQELDELVRSMDGGFGDE